MEKMLEDAKKSFQSIYGKDLQLKPQQLGVLKLLAEGENVFASLPTGFGKSLCYWLPAKAWGWKVLVVCPLISLMEDQKLALEKVGLKVLALHSNAGEKAWLIEQRIEAEDWQVCLISPERFFQWRESGFFLKIKSIGIDLLVLDEMHCIQEWREFRHGYKLIYEPIKRLLETNVPLLGLSASMPVHISHEWMHELCENPRFIYSRLGRENISLNVLPIEEGKLGWLFLVQELRNLQHPNSALVYCASRSQCEEVSQWLNSAGFNSVTYHAGLSKKLRSARLQAFRGGYLRIICCTSAFGMGIDYPFVDRVIHFSLPYSLQAYWQEVGRAGRGGVLAKAICFLRRSEINRARKMNEREKIEYEKLLHMFVSSNCRKILVGNYLGTTESACGACDNCLQTGESVSLKQNQEIDFFPKKNIWWLESAAEIHTWIRSFFQM